METDKKLYQQSAEPIVIPEGWRDRSARIISNVFSPPLIALACIVVTAHAAKADSSLWWIFMFIALLIIPPTLYILSLVHSGAVSDFHLSRREERAKPLLVIFTYASLVFVVTYLLNAPRLMIIVTGIALIQILLVFLITLRWKISGHCTSAAGLSFLAIALYGEPMIPLTLIIPVVAWSRIRLGRHTLYQTIAGTFLGAVTVIGILYMTGSLSV